METKIFNVASYKRKDSLLKTIKSIYNQADIINVALNDYNDIPTELYDKKINLFITDNSRGDAFKFIALNNSDGYFFTVDDDLIYPPDYADYMIKKINEYGKKNIITLHGRNFNKFPINSYYKSQSDKYHCLHDVSQDVKVQFGGTGVMCFHTGLLKLNIDYFQHPNMADVWIGKAAKENGIPIICVKHKKGYINYSEQRETIFDSYLNNDETQTNVANQMYGFNTKISNGSKITILSTLWNAKKFIPQFVNSIKSQTYKNFMVYVVDDNSNDGSYETLVKLTSGDNRFKIFKNTTQKFKTQNFYEIINNRNLINDDDIIIELDGDDSFYGNNVIEKVVNHFSDPNLWIAGYKWIDNRGKKSPFKFSPNADNPRSQVWSYSAMRVFKAFLFRNINKNDLMFEGDFIKAANDVAYGMPMLEMSGKEHFRSFNDITYLYNWHDKNTHSKTSSVRDTGLQKRTEKHIYSLQRYKKLVNGNVISSKHSNIVTPKITNIANTEKINKIKNLIPVTPQSKTVIEKVVEKQEVIKIVNLIPKITNNNNIRKITSQILSKPKEDNNNRSVVTNENRVKVTGQTQNNQTKNTPRFNFDIPIVKPQNKVEIDKKRQEFENVLLYTAKGKKEVKPIPPKNIGIRI